jgi:hypothetical protein
LGESVDVVVPGRLVVVRSVCGRRGWRWFCTVGVGLWGAGAGRASSLMRSVVMLWVVGLAWSGLLD